MPLGPATYELIEKPLCHVVALHIELCIPFQVFMVKTSILVAIYMSKVHVNICPHLHNLYGTQHIGMSASWRHPLAQHIGQLDGLLVIASELHQFLLDIMEFVHSSQ